MGICSCLPCYKQNGKHRYYLSMVFSIDGVNFTQVHLVQLFKTNNIVNVSLKFQMLLSEIRQYIFFLKKCEKLLHYKSFSHFFNKKYQCIC